MIEKRTISSLLFDIFLYIIMTLIFVVMVYPFWYIVVYSVSDISKIKFPLLIWPAGFNLDSYKTILLNESNIHAAFVSVARCICGPFAMLLVSGMGAYAISKPDLLFGKGIRMYMLFSMYVGAGLIPTYLLIKNLHLTNSFFVYVIPGMANIFNMILIKAYIASIPHELEEAVMIDGGSEIDAFFRVILPLMLPINAAVLLLDVIGAWNAYFDVSLYNGNTKQLYTLSYTLYINLTASQNLSLEQIRQMAAEGKPVRINNQSLNMAMTVVTMVPIMCVYPILQRYFVSGLMIGAVKM